MPRKICFLLVPNLIENCLCNIKAFHHSIGSLPECFWIYVGSVLKKALPLHVIASRVKFYFQVLSLSLTSDVKETVCIHWIYFIGHLLHVISKFSSHISQRLIKSGTFSVTGLKKFQFQFKGLLYVRDCVWSVYIYLPALSASLVCVRWWTSVSKDNFEGKAIVKRVHCVCSACNHLLWCGPPPPLLINTWSCISEPCPC